MDINRESESDTSPYEGRIDISLDERSREMLDNLVRKGVFKDESDFLAFVGKAYARNNLADLLGRGKRIDVATITGIIGSSRIAENLSDNDQRTVLAPLLLAAFGAVYRQSARKGMPAAAEAGA